MLMSKPAPVLHCPHCDTELKTLHPYYGLNEHREMLLTAGWQNLPPLEVKYSPLQFGEKQLLTNSYLLFGALDFLGSCWRALPLAEDWVAAFKARYARLYECSHCQCPLSWVEAKKQPAAADAEMR